MASSIVQRIGKQIAEARISGGGINIRHGQYLLLIKRMMAEKKFKGDCYISEFVVLESTKIEVVEADKNGVSHEKDIEPNKVGTDCSYVINFDGKGKQSAGSSAKALLCALFSVTEDQMSEDEFISTFDDVVRDRTEGDQEANPLRGWVVRLSTYPKPVQSDPGRYITGMKWESASKPGEGENAPDKVAERRRQLDGMKAA